jgi:hypothetical protein
MSFDAAPFAPKKFTDIMGRRMAYIDEGEGDPVLFQHGNPTSSPGSILTGRQRAFCRSWPKQTEVTVKGRHFIQEDCPDESGEAVANFVRGL